jgi:ParB family transcriptional regulator, chromosome partitioning protein
MSAFGTKISKLSQIQKQGTAALPGERIEELDPALIDCQKQLRSEDNPGFTIESLTELANDLERDGQHEPVVLRKNPRKTGRYLMVAGERRWRACKLKGLKLKAVVREMTDEQARRAQRAENIQRENLTQLEIAIALRDDKERLGTLERVGAEWNKGINWVAERIKFLEVVETDGVASKAVSEGVTADITAVNDLDRLEKADPAAAESIFEQAKADPNTNVRKVVREKLQRTKLDEKRQGKANSRMRETEVTETGAKQAHQQHNLHPDAASLVSEAAERSRSICEQVNLLSALLQQRRDVLDLLGDTLQSVVHAQTELYRTCHTLDTLANRK